VAHGFVRTFNGTLTEFDAPGAANGSTRGTVPISINSAGTVVGFVSDSNNVYHGFLRLANGVMTEFDVPNADQSGH